MLIRVEYNYQQWEVNRADLPLPRDTNFVIHVSAECKLKNGNIRQAPKTTVYPGKARWLGKISLK